MKRTALAALVIMVTTAAHADDLTGRAIFGYEGVENGIQSTSGFRQTYDLRMDKALSTASIFGLFFRGDAFKGSETSSLVSRDSGTRLLQPGALFNLELNTMSLNLRTEAIDTKSTSGNTDYNRRQDRSSGAFTWAPESLPLLTMVGQRLKTTDQAAGLSVDDQSATAELQYAWRGLAAMAQNQYSHTADQGIGYDRKSTMQMLGLGYAGANFGGRLTYAADGTAQILHSDETAPANQTALIPTPVTISHVLWTIDDTPLDNRDHPAASYPALNDGDLNKSSGISVGPDGQSFQNVIIDIGHLDRADEIRIVVRDSAGNPLTTGGGAVTWDLYTSLDGDIWTPSTSSTTFSNALSLYSVTFVQTTTRWLKVVNFGVNSDPTFITEVQAFYHTQIAAGQTRQGQQNVYTSTFTVSARPIDRLGIGYSGLYSSIREDIGLQAVNTTTDLENVLNLQYDLTHIWSVRSEMLKRNVTSRIGNGDDATGIRGYLDFTPTKQLKVSFEAGHENQTLDGAPFGINTIALHTTAYVLRSLSVMFDAGKQKQTIASDGSIATRDFLDFTTNAQLTPRLRLLLTGSMQRTLTDSRDPAVALLGPVRDNRVDADFMWRAGHELTIGARVGWVSGLLLSGLTQQYRLEWFPFADGTVALGGSYQEDIDPTLNRKASRLIFNPRWLINRWATFDLNYADFRTQSAFDTVSRRSLFATLTLYR